jgi:hypothetical protein
MALSATGKIGQHLLALSGLDYESGLEPFEDYEIFRNNK